MHSKNTAINIKKYHNKLLHSNLCYGKVLTSAVTWVSTRVTSLASTRVTSLASTQVFTCAVELNTGWRAWAERPIYGQPAISSWPTHSIAGTCPLSHIPTAHIEHRFCRVHGIFSISLNWCIKALAYSITSALGEKTVKNKLHVLKNIYSNEYLSTTCTFQVISFRIEKIPIRSYTSYI